MRNQRTYSTQFKEKSESKPKVAMFFVYLVLGLSLCVFAASVWFSSYPKKVHFQHKPLLERQAKKIQNEIFKLELEENALTDVERIRSLIKELGLVEPTTKAIDIWER